MGLNLLKRFNNTKMLFIPFSLIKNYWRSFDVYEKPQNLP